MMLIAHVITSLGDGGAESVLFRLCTADTFNQHVVISLQGFGKYGEPLRKSGITVHCLKMPQGKITFWGIWQLAKLLRSYRPNVVQTWMYHSDLIGGVVAWLVGIHRICWGLRNANFESDKTKFSTIMVIKLNALLSHWVPNCIVSCSENGVETHKAIGYRADKFNIIPNGYDLHQFTPQSQGSNALKLALAIPDGVPLLGMVARFDLQKDHHNLIVALGLLKHSGRDYRCVLVGRGMDASNMELLSWIGEQGIQDCVLLLGQRTDIPAVMNILDVHVLSSAGEAFPNVLCEAMACGIPCVSTNVGDAALIVGETGWIVPAKSPFDLYRALVTALDLKQKDPADWAKRKSYARQRILENFSIEKMVNSYHLAWQE
jgi:glycosyltransferase involved in cell wall biosynthesis